MDGYQVDIDELGRAENLVRELGTSFAASTSLKYSIAPSEVGNDDLARALTEFRDHSRQAADDLCATAEDSATRLRDTATAYLAQDQASAEAITGRDIR